MELSIIAGLIAFLVVLLLLRYTASPGKAGLDRTLDESNPAAPTPASPSRGVVPVQSLAVPGEFAGLFAEILPKAFVWGIGLALGFLVVQLPLAFLVGIILALLP